MNLHKIGHNIEMVYISKVYTFYFKLFTYKKKNIKLVCSKDYLISSGANSYGKSQV